LAEAASLYEKDPSTLRNAIRREVFLPEEVKQSGSTWLVTKAGMDRVYGKRLGEEEKPALKEGFYIHCPRCANQMVMAFPDGTLECSECELHFNIQVLPPL